VNEEIDHDGPSLGAGDDTAHAEDLTSEEPVHESNGLLTVGVAGDSDIDEGERSIDIAESNGGDVHVRRLLEGLVVSDGVSDDQEARLNEALLGLVGESTRSEAGTNVGAASVGGELEDSALADLASRDDNDVLRVLDSDDDTSSEAELLPGLADVDDVNTIRAAAPDVAGACRVEVLGAEVNLSSEHELDVVLL